MDQAKFESVCKNWGIALTGGIASGKSTIAATLRSLGYLVIDADHISRLIVAVGTEGLREVVAAFGEVILNDRGELDRPRMRQIVFQSADKRQILESIIYKRLNSKTAELLSQAGIENNPRPWFYEASLIFERQRQKDFAEVWLAYCPLEIQVARLQNRDKSTPEEAKAILAAQMPPDEKLKLADFVLHTDCSPEELRIRVLAATENLKQRRGSS